MEVFFGHEAAGRRVGRPFVVLGNFDGLHRGHQALLETTVQLAKDCQVPSMLFTFWPPPSHYFDRASKPLLLTLERKLELLTQSSLDAVLVEPFNHGLAQMPARQFVETILLGSLNVSGVVVGANFRFGKGALGSVAELSEWLGAAGVTLKVVPLLSVGTHPCSSSRIRSLLLSGEVAEAAALLGRPYELTGKVVRGHGRGRGIGIPTANLAPDAELIPKDGVYATRVTVEGQTFLAATNIGTRPTFDDAGSRHIETHIIGFDGDVYGQALRIAFRRRIRDEQRFLSVEALKAQVQEDLENAQRS